MVGIGITIAYFVVAVLLWVGFEDYSTGRDNKIDK